ncbi:hypothetical protein [Clostridium sp. YIM B02551]|uniref:hypothetical protein n=1 Tax=Clostridium sp. YIM B02551 TaxID=2910679 RepID=UPI001EEBBC2F|nr:hypothetical protein [Clostridium sp. YIM B02551]
MSKVTEYYITTGKEVNEWDYFFRIFSNPFVLVWLLIPLLFFITSPVSNVNSENKYIYIRALNKYKIIISKQIANLIIISACIVGISILIFLLGIYYSKFELAWSSAILSEKNVEVAKKYLFFNNFIEYYNPVEAAVLSILKFLGTTYLIVLLRDLIIYILKNYILSIIICFIYLLINYRDVTTLRYFSIGELGTLWCHDFSGNRLVENALPNAYKLSTVAFSNILLIIMIIMLLIMTIVSFRRSEVEKL